MRTGENIYKRKDGRWEARSPIGYTSSGRLRYKYLYGSTYREVKQKKRLYEEQNYSKEIVDCQKNQDVSMLFGDVAKMWLTAFSAVWKPATYSKYENCLRKYILPNWEHRPFMDITQKEYDEFLFELVEKNISCTTANVVLRGIQKYLREKGEVSFQFSIFSTEGQKISIKQVEPLSDAEWQTLLNYSIEHLDGTTLGLLICMYEGVRIGELCALRWKDVDYTKHTLHIRETVQRLQSQHTLPGQPKTYLSFGAPKNGRERWIPIHPQLLVLLKKKNQNVTPEDFILTSSKAIVEPRTFTNRFHKILEICGIRKVHAHLLRHSFASRCVETGIDIKVLSDILGHKTVKITMDRYVHLSMPYKQKQLEMLTFSDCKSRQKKRQSI